MNERVAPTRSFKTAWFSKQAKKAAIGDGELCAALDEAKRGQADDLGDGVFKKRLNRNRHRSIILARGGRLWVYQYVFAKQDRANIRSDELEDFRVLARGYARLTDGQIAQLLSDGDIVEICHGSKA